MSSIVIYHSYTGNTKMIAEKIKLTLNCDILELKPLAPFSSDYDEVVREYQNNENAKSVVGIEHFDIDLSKYDTIILGTPVWWYSLTPVVRKFLQSYDLNGKTIIPFATNGGLIGRTFKEIKELCPNSIIKNEFDIPFSQNTPAISQDEFDIWIQSLQQN